MDFNYPFFKKQQMTASNQSEAITKQHKNNTIYIQMPITNIINEKGDTVFVLTSGQTLAE